MIPRIAAVLVCWAIAQSGFAQSDSSEPDPARFQPIDVFALEHASDPRLSPDGNTVVYVRNFFDIMTDAKRSNLWQIAYDGSAHRPVTTGNENHSAPRWSPDGARLAYVSGEDGTTQLYVRWMDTGQTAKVTNLAERPAALEWSPNGKWLAFTMHVPHKPESLATLPPKPEGAAWAEEAKVIDKYVYRRDGSGYVKNGFSHIFVVPSEGGHPRQVTSGDFDHRGPLSWTPDGAAIVFSGNRRENWEQNPSNSEVYRVGISDGAIAQLTQREGPDNAPAVSPDGKLIAYTGFDDQKLSYQVADLYIMNANGTNPRKLIQNFDRTVRNPRWAPSSMGIYFTYDEEGKTKLALTDLNGNVSTLAETVGGMSLGRPYPGGAIDASLNARYVYTHTTPARPADIAVGSINEEADRVITALNADLLDHKKLGAVEEIWATSSFDGRKIHGWIMTPPDFDPQKQYPLILEIHGGPWANYGPRFSAEMQLMAAADYVVLYTNPRGSTSYGQTFGNLIHHHYPGEDYDDLISSVDAVIERGYTDTERLYVTGGSGGGILSAWIVGKTDRFAAAAIAKPVINWYSQILTGDAYHYWYQYWFPGPPWEHQDHYMSHSPISLVGNVSTPSLLITGEHDLRTPMSETEQYYQALQIRGIDSVMVRIPEASHNIARRPSYLISKIAHVLAWFERYPEKAESANAPDAAN